MQKLLILLISIAKINAISMKQFTQGNYEEVYHHHKLCKHLLNFSGVFYALDEEWNVNGIPADINVHWKTGDVYFTLINELLTMALTVLKPDGSLEAIELNDLGQTTAVDNTNDVIYLATNNGVYKFKDGIAHKFTANGRDIMYLAASGDGMTLYIATWPHNKVQKIKNGELEEELFTDIPNGHGMAIDVRNNIYFMAAQTLYVLKNGARKAVPIAGLPKERVIGVSFSRSDEVYTMDENSILYVIDINNVNAKVLGSFGIVGVNSFAVDATDNILIGIKRAILKFKSFPRNPCSRKAVSRDDVKLPSVVPRKLPNKTPSPLMKTTTVKIEDSEEYDDEESSTAATT